MVASVSIVLPTFNRHDVLRRALDSVLGQTYGDWELIVIDDGSTDGTPALFREHDSRIRYVRQENSGVYAARNHGLSLVRGRYVTFLDSDDEWLPHYLELTVSFLEAFPDERYVITELWHDHGHQPPLRIHRDAVRAFAALAPRVGRDALRLPPGESDDYLRVYESREPLGAWGSKIAERAGYGGAWIYRGRIFRHFRWGYLGWLPTTMLRAEVLGYVRPFDESLKTTDDYRFLADLSRQFRTNMIAVPCAIKHEVGLADEPLAEEHLATGASGYRFAITRLRLFDGLYVADEDFDRETIRIRALHEHFAGRVALSMGKRREAIFHLREAWRANRSLWGAAWLWLFAKSIPSAAVSARLYVLGIRGLRIRRALARWGRRFTDFGRAIAGRVGIWPRA